MCHIRSTAKLGKAGLVVEFSTSDRRIINFTPLPSEKGTT